MKKNKKKAILFLLIFTFISFIFITVSAETEAINKATEDYEATAGGLGYKNNQNVLEEALPTIRDTIIKLVLSVLGVFFLILIIIGGYQWMTAGGNDEIIGKAKKRIMNATIGLVIVLAAYIITSLIVEVLFKNTAAIPVSE